MLMRVHKNPISEMRERSIAIMCVNITNFFVKLQRKTHPSSYDQVTINAQ